MQLRYDLFIQQIYLDSRQEGPCICKESFLVENLSTSPYSFQKDPVLERLFRDLYYRVGSWEESLRRTEDKLVVDYITVIGQAQVPQLTEVNWDKRRPESVEQAKQEALEQFKILEDRIEEAERQIIRLWKDTICPEFLFENLFKQDRLQDKSLAFDLGRLNGLVLQLRVEGRRYRVLNRFAILQQVEQKYGLRGVIHATQPNP